MRRLWFAAMRPFRLRVECPFCADVGEGVRPKPGAWRVNPKWAETLASSFDEADNMCPNCVTPWKCNGPHLSEETVASKMESAPVSQGWSVSAFWRLVCRRRGHAEARFVMLPEFFGLYRYSRIECRRCGTTLEHGYQPTVEEEAAYWVWANEQDA